MKIYNRHSYLREKGEVLAALVGQIETILNIPAEKHARLRLQA